MAASVNFKNSSEASLLTTNNTFARRLENINGCKWFSKEIVEFGQVDKCLKDMPQGTWILWLGQKDNVVFISYVSSDKTVIHYPIPDQLGNDILIDREMGAHIAQIKGLYFPYIELVLLQKKNILLPTNQSKEKVVERITTLLQRIYGKNWANKQDSMNFAFVLREPSKPEGFLVFTFFAKTIQHAGKVAFDVERGVWTLTFNKETKFTDEDLFKLIEDKLKWPLQTSLINLELQLERVSELIHHEKAQAFSKTPLVDQLELIEKCVYALAKRGDRQSLTLLNYTQNYMNFPQMQHTLNEVTLLLAQFGSAMDAMKAVAYTFDFFKQFPGVQGLQDEARAAAVKIIKILIDKEDIKSAAETLKIAAKEIVSTLSLSDKDLVEIFDYLIVKCNPNLVIEFMHSSTPLSIRKIAQAYVEKYGFQKALMFSKLFKKENQSDLWILDDHGIRGIFLEAIGMLFIQNNHIVDVAEFASIATTPYSDAFVKGIIKYLLQNNRSSDAYTASRSIFSKNLKEQLLNEVLPLFLMENRVTEAAVIASCLTYPKWINSGYKLIIKYLIQINKPNEAKTYLPFLTDETLRKELSQKIVPNESL